MAEATADLRKSMRRRFSRRHRGGKCANRAGLSEARSVNSVCDWTDGCPPKEMRLATPSRRRVVPASSPRYHVSNTAYARCAP